MSSSTLIKMPDVDVSGPQAGQKILEMKDRLNMLNWYLIGKAVDDFFKRWPDIKSLSLENNGNDEQPQMWFTEEEWVDGYRYDLKKEFRDKLDNDLAGLDRATSAMVEGRVWRSLDTLFSVRYLQAGKVMEVFGRCWRSRLDNPQEQWTALMAEVENASLDGSVDQPASSEARAAPRM